MNNEGNKADYLFAYWDFNDRLSGPIVFINLCDAK